MAVDWHTCPKCKERHLGRNRYLPSPDSVCDSCFRAANDDGEFDSEGAIRCPKCGGVESDGCTLGEMGLYSGEDLYTVDCNHCDQEFDVAVDTTITFTSPARVK